MAVLGEFPGELDRAELVVTVQFLDQVLNVKRPLMRRGVRTRGMIAQTGLTLGDPAGVPLAQRLPDDLELGRDVTNRAAPINFQTSTSDTTLTTWCAIDVGV